MYDLGLLAGIVSTALFTLSQIPMLVRAFRTKNLHSYSATSLVLANLGNLIHWRYMYTLPWGPIWLLHGFHTLVAALMLVSYMRYRLVTT